MACWMRRRIAGLVLALLAAISVTVPTQGLAEVSRDLLVRYILATVQAFRAVYVEHVTERVSRVGVLPKEDWMQDDHAIMLPFQFVKMAGQEIKGRVKDIEIGLVSLTPLYSSNFPRTEAEVNALEKLVADPALKVVTFADGKDFKGIAGDFAIEQSCADCHNRHPNSLKKDFKKGDIMGAVIVRLKS